MVDTVYIETSVYQHPRTKRILNRLKHASIIEINHFGEVFNPKAQNFKLQKNNPALIIANKNNRHVLPAPEGYGFGSSENYYFSHMLNCVYDCRYCFLQGMYRSAHYVLFVNYEDFFDEIGHTAQQTPNKAVWFYSGYDCDSLAYEPVTQFCDFLISKWHQIENGWLELRTKSTQVRQLLKHDVNERIVVAFSFTETQTHKKLEHGVPSISKRIEALKKCQSAGWKIGLRFDPIIYHQNYQQGFQQLLKDIFTQLDAQSIHSVSLGPFRLPKQIYKNIAQLYPQEKLIHQPFSLHGNIMSYEQNRESKMIEFCENQLLNYIKPDQYFRCEYE